MLAVLIAVAMLAYLPVAAATGSALTDTGEGEVIGVIDGDTIEVLVSAQTAMSLGFPRRKNPLPIRLRLDQVDTPERGQPWANRAKQALSALIFGKPVRFRLLEADRYDRHVAHVFIGDVWVNSWLVEQGHGWAYRRYAEQATLLCILEERARVARRGLWSRPPNEWEPPWVWRRHGPAEAFAPSLEECLAASGRPGRRR
ncbi:MAG: thermonuclease family protein [Steroidobacteraceae bacterium]|jgi:endonuclease YncB( thermonuclease family)|nr:thermonuclease family protein [Steroidobacteraceae bacterium]